MIETGFGHPEQGAVIHVFELEFHQRGWLLGVVDFRVDGIWVPAKRKQPFRLDPLHQHIPQQVLIPGIGYLPLGPLTGDETLAFQRHAKPLPERLGIGQHAPDV
ncbi:hypothetical protein D3C84_1001030 [compost metagenome]